MRQLILLVILAVSSPLYASGSDDNNSFYVAISQCLKRAMGSRSADTPQCDWLFKSVAPSVEKAVVLKEKIAAGQPPTDINPCTGFSVEFGLDYIPVYAGKNSRACVTEDQLQALQDATVRYRQTPGLNRPWAF